MNTPLHATTSRAHAHLRQHLDSATAAVLEKVGRRESMQKVDAFLIDTVRHVSAACDVIAPAARAKLRNGDERARAFVRQARIVERAVARTKRRLYGESHAVDLSWADVWSHLRQELDRLQEIERELVTDLADVVTFPRSRILADRIEAAQASAPTRPHPGSPHSGWFGHLSRGILARTDHFWDAAEGRILPMQPAGETEAEPLAS